MAKGRPQLSEYQRMGILRKLEPYLKIGMSVNKACIQSGVPKSTVFDYLEKDVEFSEHVRAMQGFTCVMINSLVFQQLMSLVKKQARGTVFSWSDLSFLMWLATHSVATREEFDRPTKTGNQQFLYDYDVDLEVRNLLKMTT